MKGNWYKHFMVLNSCLGNLAAGFFMVTINKGTTYPENWKINISLYNYQNFNDNSSLNEYDNIFIIDSILSAGGFAGSMLTGLLSWIYGRRPCLVLADAIVLFAMIPPLFTDEVTVFASVQFCFGLSCGINFALAYLYMKEICIEGEYEHYRLIPQIFLTFGNLLGGVLWKAEPSWKLMLLLPGAFACIRLAMLHFVFFYDTPFYYIHKYEENAKSNAALEKIFQAQSSEATIQEIKTRIKQAESLISPSFRLGDLLKDKLWKATLTGFALIVVNQTSGVNFFLFFSGLYFQSMKVPAIDYIFLLLNFLFSFLPLVLIKYFKKKTLLISGVGFTTFLIVLANILTKNFDSQGVAIVYIIMLVFFYLIFEASLAGLVHSVIAETLPDIGTILIMSFHWIILLMITLTYRPSISYFQGIAILFSIINTLIYLILIYLYDDNVGIHAVNSGNEKKERLIALNSK